MNKLKNINYMFTLNFRLGGLTCEACVKLVAKRLQKITGVTNVIIDLTSGKSSVISKTELSLNEIRQSLAETEYIIID